MPLEVADKTVICSASQASLLSRSWSLVRYSLMGFSLVQIWLSYTGCQMIYIWSKREVLKLHFDCQLSLYAYNLDIKPVLICKGTNSTDDVLSGSCIFVMSVCPIFALLPIYIHGTSCQNESATSKWTMSIHACCWLYFGRSNINVSVIVIQSESRFICDGILSYFVVRISEWGLHFDNSLVVVMTLQHS